MQGNVFSAMKADTMRYVVRSSDVLEDMRIDVYEEGSDKVIWYKERFLTDDEILEHVVDNATSTILWTVHRPKRGWYIRLRPPSFPAGVFIPLLPLPQTSPYFCEAALSFACRTSLPSTRPSAFTNHSTDSDVTLTEGTSPPTGEPRHSYPPTPPTGPTILVNPPSPRSVHAKLDSVSLSPPRTIRRLSSQPAQASVTHFVLSPNASRVVRSAQGPTQQPSLFSRLMAAIKSNTPTHDYSFSLSPIPSPSSMIKATAPASASFASPISPTASAPGIPLVAASPSTRPGQTNANPLVPTPLLKFQDRTPMWTARCSSGVIELDEGQCRVLGVEPAFYVAVALTYLEFLEERESYLVAAYD